MLPTKSLSLSTILLLLALPASSEVLLTADVYDTPGMPGFQTYDLVATSVGGYVNAFDFYGNGRGITGPLHQRGGALLDQDHLFAGLSTEPVDSHWLVNSNDGLSIGMGQSGQGLNAAYTFTRVGGQTDSHRQLPFARLVTDDPASVSLNGQFLVAERYSSTSLLLRQPEVVEVDYQLSNIQTGGAPVLGAFFDPIGPSQAELELMPGGDWFEGLLRAQAAASETGKLSRLDQLSAYERSIDWESGLYEFDLAKQAEQRADTLFRREERREQYRLEREQREADKQVQRELSRQQERLAEEQWLVELTDPQGTEPHHSGLGTGYPVDETEERPLNDSAEIQRLAELETLTSAAEQLDLRIRSGQIGLGVTPIATERLADAMTRGRLTSARPLSGLQSAMQTALSGLQAAETTITHVGLDIANRNTVGFKASEVVFATDFLATIPTVSIERQRLDLSYAIDTDFSSEVSSLYVLDDGQARMIPEPAAFGLAALAMLALADPRRITP